MKNRILQISTMILLSSWSFAQEWTVNSDQWVATDNLGRELPSSSETGPVKTDKKIGMFYWTWHTDDLATWTMRDGTIPNLTEILNQYPEAANDLHHSVWQNPSEGGTYWWDEPLFGYYRTTDEWVLRKHAEMLADAGVDVVFFDNTNGNYTWKSSYTVLMEVWNQARQDGVKTPQIAFLLPFSATSGALEQLNELYTEVYEPGLYQDLWYMHDGKPLIMAYPEIVDDNTVIANEMKDFFTFRPGQPGYKGGPSRDDHWGWLEVYPQNAYGPKADGTYEQATVGVAQNASDASGGLACAFNGEGTYGRSYTHTNGMVDSENAYLYGYNVQEQWDRAFEIDPELIFITGWNEWTAGMWFDWDVQPFAFVDQYNAEKSRDIEPVKSWGNNGDVYYMQLVDYVRQFKGMEDPLPVSQDKTIDISDLSSWTDVTPEYNSYKGNTLHRNHPGQGHSLIYTNSTGRNDIVKAKVTCDEEYVYFLVETDNILSDKTDQNWMRLFIDIDRDKETGWEGYDYIINRTNPEDSVIVERSIAGWEWTTAGKGGFVVNEKSLVLKIRRNVLGKANDERLNFEFKWSDNMQDEGNIMDFYVNGDVAPGGRFNYVYTECITIDGYHCAHDPLNINQGIKCKQYNGTFETIPDFNNLTAIETHYLSQFILPETGTSNYALQYTGFIDVPAKEAYNFTLNANLAARLYIDDILLVESSGSQGEQTGNINLMPGKHAYVLEYIANQGNTPFIEIFLESASIIKAAIPESMLFKYNDHPEINMIYMNNQIYFSEIDTVFFVKATDPDGSIQKIEVYDNETLILEETSNEFFLKDFTIGEHSVYAVVTDNNGTQTESGTLSFSVKSAFLVPGLITIDEYRSGTDVVVIDWDEDDGEVSIKSAFGAVDYPIDVSEAGTYEVIFRIPSSSDSKELGIKINREEITTVTLEYTATDEEWCNFSTNIHLEEGIQILGFDFKGVITIYRIELAKSVINLEYEKKIKAFSVFPNPSSGEFIVNSQNTLTGITICDLTGKIVDQYPTKLSNFEYQIGGCLTPGLYFLKVFYSDGSIQTQKIVKE